MNAYNIQDSLDELQKQLTNLTLVEGQLPASEEPKISSLKARIHLSSQTMASNLENGQQNSDETNATYTALRHEIAAFLTEKLSTQTKIRSDKLTSLEKLLPDSKKAQNIKSEIRALENEKTTLSHNFPSHHRIYHQTTIEIITIQKQLQNEAETCIKEHISEQIESRLAQLTAIASQSQRPAEAKPVTTKLREEALALFERCSTHKDDSQELEKIMADGGKLLKKIDGSIKEYISDTLQRFVNNLKLAAEQLPESKETKEIRAKLNEQQTTLKKLTITSSSSTDDLQKLEQINTRCEELITKANTFTIKSIETWLKTAPEQLKALKERLPISSEAKNLTKKINILHKELSSLDKEYFTSIVNRITFKKTISYHESLLAQAKSLIDIHAAEQRQKLLGSLLFIKDKLPSSEAAKSIKDDLDLQCKEIRNLAASSSSDHGMQKLTEIQATCEKLIEKAESLIKESGPQKLMAIEEDIATLKNQLTEDNRALLQAITDFEGTPIAADVPQLRETIKSTINKIDTLSKEKLTAAKKALENLHQRAQEKITQLEQYAERQEQLKKSITSDKKEEEKSTKPKRIPAGSAQNLNSAGVFSSTASSSTTTQSTSQSSSAPAIAPKPRNIWLILESINTLKSVYTSTIKPTAGINTKFLSYIQRACLFISVQSLLEHMDDHLAGREDLTKVRDCLAHNLPQTKTVFSEAAEHGTNIFIAFADLVMPLLQTKIPKKKKQSLNESCKHVFSQKNLEKHAIKPLIVDSKRIPPSKTLKTEKDLENHIQDIENRIMAFTKRSSLLDSNKNDLCIIVSAFFKAELDARMSDEIGTHQKEFLKKKFDDWFGKILNEGRTTRHESTNVLLEIILNTEHPAAPKAQEDKPAGGDDSAQLPLPSEEQTSYSSSSSLG